MNRIEVRRSTVRKCESCRNERVRFTYAVRILGPHASHLCTNCVDVLRRGILEAKRSVERPGHRSLAARAERRG
jgi:hypothetical protein